MSRASTTFSGICSKLAWSICCLTPLSNTSKSAGLSPWSGRPCCVTSTSTLTASMRLVNVWLSPTAVVAQAIASAAAPITEGRSMSTTDPAGAFPVGAVSRAPAARFAPPRDCPCGERCNSRPAGASARGDTTRRRVRVPRAPQRNRRRPRFRGRARGARNTRSSGLALAPSSMARRSSITAASCWPRPPSTFPCRTRASRCRGSFSRALRK